MAAHQASHVKKIFHMWSPPQTGAALHHAQITFNVTSVIACTEGWGCGIQLVTSDSPPTPEVYAQLLADHAGAWTGANHAIEAAGAGDSATLAAILYLAGLILKWGSTSADQVNIDAGASEIVGINYTINLNAETADVPLINQGACVAS